MLSSRPRGHKLVIGRFMGGRAAQPQPRRRGFAFRAGAGLALLLCGAAASLAVAAAGGDGRRPAATAGSGTVTVRLIAFNDLHGHLDPSGWVPVAAARDEAAPMRLPAGGVAYLASLVQRLRAEVRYSVVVGAGDMVGASPLESAHFHDEPTIEALNALGLEYTAVGNHEFDHGVGELLRLQRGGCALPRDATTCQSGAPSSGASSSGASSRGAPGGPSGGRFAGADFRYLAANVIDRRRGATLFPGYAIKTFAVAGRSLKLGFIGAVLRQTPHMVAPGRTAGLAFTDEATAVNALIPELKRQGVHAVVLLIHQGVETDGGYDDPRCPGVRGGLLPTLARLDPLIRVVVSGHTHRAYVCHADRAGGGDLLYSSAGSYGRYLTDIDLQLDVASGRLLSASAHNRIVVNDTATDPDPRDDPPLPAQPAVAAIVEHYDRRVAALKSRVLGRLEGAFTRTANAAGESALGDLVADAQLAATAAPEDGGADIAMTNPGGLRAGLSQPGGSVVSFGDVFTAQPFNNTLVTISLRGDALKALLEQQWRSATAPPRVLQVSQGFRYAWRAHAARGHHVDAASMRLHGAPIEPARVYKVTVNSFLAGGGDGFPVLRDAPARIESATLDADALARYIERHAPLAVPRADRILRQD